jgi:tetratricopeptide (TPR) repeat protein
MKALAIFLAVTAIAASVVHGQESSASTNEALQKAHQLVMAHELQKANLILSDVVSREPGNEEALLELGQVQVELGLNDDAMKSFEAVLAVKPDSAPARAGEVKAAIAAALADRKIGLDGDALLYLIRARKLVPDSPELLLDFGVQAEGMRIFHDADDALTRARQIAPNDLNILYALAHVELDEQKMPEAESNLRAYLKERPDDATAHYGLGKLLHMELKNDEAKAELERSIALQPRQSASYYELGEIALEQDEDGDAKSEFQKALSLAPHHGGALTGMGILALRAKDYPAAEQYLTEAILYAPDYATAHHYYALVLMRLGRTDDAKREAELARTLDEDQTKMSQGDFLTVIP